MTHIVSFDPSHLEGVTVHPLQTEFQWVVDQRLINNGWTFFDGEDPICFMDMYETEDGQSGGLLFTNRMRPGHLLPIYRSCRGIIQAIEADGDKMVFDMDLNNPAVKRWADLMDMVPIKTWDMEGRTITRMQQRVL